ncbi:hypothetical protein [Caballeronia sp. dw_19]|uniref:hypothetical protein n=1 Tax=Caballeronia sp. dw_19 TaxID=2719791 RepID=UPI001BD45B65|nr:hypothetical protein [Caballeronia sp. dw_19]
MKHTLEASRIPEEHRDAKAEEAKRAEQANMAGKQGRRAGTDSRADPSPDSKQTARDVEEKNKHPASENALDSSQDKNPIPPGSTAN